MGWVAHGLDHQRGLLGRVNHGHQQSLCAHIQILLDECHIALHGAHDGVHGVRRHGAQLFQHGAHIVGCVFAIEQQPIKAATGQGFGHIGVSEANPQTNLTLACFERVAECVFGDLHGASPYTKRNCS